MALYVFAVCWCHLLFTSYSCLSLSEGVLHNTTRQCWIISMRLKPLHIWLFCLYQCRRATTHFRITTLLPHCILHSNAWIALHYTFLLSCQSGLLECGWNIAGCLLSLVRSGLPGGWNACLEYKTRPTKQGGSDHLNIIIQAMQMNRRLALNTRPQKSDDEDEVIRLSDHRSNIGGGSRE